VRRCRICSLAVVRERGCIHDPHSRFFEPLHLHHRICNTIKGTTTVPAFIRHPKDFWSGIVFLIFGLSAVIIGQEYELGSAGRMGPAYFPIALGILLSLVGLASFVRSFFRPGEAIGRIYYRELTIVLVAVLLFGFLVRNAGLVPAGFLLILISSYASDKFELKKSLALAVGMTLFAVGLFVKLLGLPMPIIGPWLGGN
jgi:hypothetical protein